MKPVKVGSFWRYPRPIAPRHPRTGSPVERAYWFRFLSYGEASAVISHYVKQGYHWHRSRRTYGADLEKESYDVTIFKPCSNT